MGVPELLRMVVRQDGFKALYRGVTPSLLGIIPYAGIAFSINEQAKHKVRNVEYCPRWSGMCSFWARVPACIQMRRDLSVRCAAQDGVPSNSFNRGSVGVFAGLGLV